MASVCLYLHIHQPYRVKRYGLFDVGNDPEYFNHDGEEDLNNARIVRKVTQKSYLPTMDLLLVLLARHPEFRVSFSVSGVALEQLMQYAPEVVERLRVLAQTGQVEFLAETYYHSLAFFYSLPEFEAQVAAHRELLARELSVVPRVFRNTELAYVNELARWAEGAGYTGIIAEGWDPVLQGRSPNYLYRPQGTQKIGLLLKNYKLSDDIAFRFSSRDWAEYPLTAGKFSQWVHALHGSADTVNLFMDFETFGEHQWEDSGIFTFLAGVVPELLTHPDLRFMTPSETIASYPVRDSVDMPSVVTWADTERDLTAWTGNEMQRTALWHVYALEERMKNASDRLKEAWRRLQTSDHFYYMCTKWFSDGDVHAYFSPYRTPHEAHVAYMNALKDLELRLMREEAALSYA